MSDDRPIKRQRVGEESIVDRDSDILEVYSLEGDENSSNYSYGSEDVIDVDNKPAPVYHLLEEEQRRADTIRFAHQAAQELDVLEDLYLEAIFKIEKNLAEPFSAYCQELGNHDLDWIASLSSDNKRRVDRLKVIDKLPNSLECFGSVTLINNKSTVWRSERYCNNTCEKTDQG